MAAVAGAKTCHATLSTTTADVVTLSDRVQFVRVTNHHTVPLYVTVSTGNTAAGAAAGAVAAVSQADETIGVAPGETKSVMKSPGRGVYVVLGIIGNANPYSVEGSNVDLDS